MSQYNLVRNAYFDSLTTSGTGNTSLTWTQLESLMDGVTTSGGVTLTSSGILFLEVDLSQRIKVDEIRLYADDLGQAAYINFYYKNATGDSYTLLATQSGSYYYATISDPSAPRYIRATISGVAITLYEFEILNDDYIVAFGDDGTQYAEYLADTPIGEEGTPQAVAIFNNGTGAMPADAYVCIDYTGEVADEYVKISASENGTYYGINDGALIEDNQIDSEYRWDMGIHTQTSTSTDKILNQPSSSVSLKLLPLIAASEGFNDGANCWDYDNVNKRMYVMGKDGSALKLWSYDQLTTNWTYVTQVNASGTNDDNAAVMAYCNGAIYAMCKVDGTQFGMYTISGVVDNWTALTNPTWAVTPIPGSPNYDRVGLCSDGTRYIYALVSRGNTASNKEFKRYDTVSGTWSALNTGWGIYFLGVGQGNNTVCLSYDKDRDCIYGIIYPTEESAGSGAANNWIQRYRVNNDAWDVAFVYVGGVIDINWMRCGLSYYGNRIYFTTPKDSTNQYYMGMYNLSTSQISTVYIGYRHFDPVSGDVGLPVLATGFGVFIGQIDSYRNYMVKYMADPIYFADKIGVYTSPVFALEESNNASYFLVNGTATSGTGNISYDEGSYNGTIRVRSSNTAPAAVEEIYVAYRYDPFGGAYYRYMAKYDIYNSVKTVIVNSRPIDVNVATGGIVDRRSGKIIFIVDTWSAGPVYLYVYDRNYNLLTTLTAPTRNYLFNVRAEFDSVGGLWGYSNYVTPYTLFHLYPNSVSTLANITDGTDFLYDLAAEWDGLGVWYTDKVSNLVRHRNSAGTLLQSVALPQPRAICATSDNGCWVIDNTNTTAYRYTFSGGLSQTVSLGRTASRMTFDYSDGFWYISGLHVYHVTSNGIEDVDLIFDSPTYIAGSRSGCAVYNNISRQLKFINYASKSVSRTWVLEYTPVVGPLYIACLSVNLDDSSDFQGLDAYDVLPMPADLVWGTVSGSLAWQEIRKDGYFLPKAKYHQIEVTLRGDATIEKILMPPAIKVQDIASQTYKDMYVKTDIPLDANITDYEARIKTWWGVE